jgi:RND family efflux transporter MFP subunit
MKHLFFSLGGLLLLAGCAKQNEFVPPPPPQVGVEPPTIQDVTLYQTFPGRVEARDSVVIEARVSGFLETIHFEDGADVKKGDPLFTIEQAGYQAALNASKAQLAQARAAESLAEASLSRKKKAFESQAVSELDVLSAEADLEAAAAAVQAAEAAVESAELDFSYTEIVAPMDGRMSDSAVSVGNLVGPGGVTDLAFLVSTDQANVIFSMDERRLLPKMRMLAEASGVGVERLPNVRLSLADGKLYPEEGKVDFADNVVNAQTGTLDVRAIFENPQGLLIDGMFARVEIPIPVSGAMLVPETAIQKDLVGSFVYTLNGEDMVEATYLETGALTEGQRIVTGGLDPGARVVTRGIQRVRPGVKAAVSTGAAE